MKCFVTSIGEKTTDLCCSQLQKFGFEVVLLDKVEPWITKYESFLLQADEDCLRIDADVLVNKHIVECVDDPFDFFMIQYKTYDLYRNDVGITSPVRYSKEGLELIRAQISKLSEGRPEATAWRLPKVVDNTFTRDLIVGMHGFFQDDLAVNRAIENKLSRKQSSQYDWPFVWKTRDLT